MLYKQLQQTFDINTFIRHYELQNLLNYGNDLILMLNKFYFVILFVNIEMLAIVVILFLLRVPEIILQ